jgi:hypothetical protein
MFDHVLLNVSNRKESMKFYTPVLQVLGIKALYDQDRYTAYGTDSFHFWLHESESKDVTHKVHLAFSAGSRKQVDELRDGTRIWRAIKWSTGTTGARSKLLCRLRARL